MDIKNGKETSINQNKERKKRLDNVLRICYNYTISKTEMENKMKVSEKTINLLRNYANINQSIEFREGKILKTVSPLNTILASVEVEEEFPRTFPIYELNRFLGTLALFQNPELDFTDNGVIISDDNIIHMGGPGSTCITLKIYSST